MSGTHNQAVIFTKPVHHLEMDLTPVHLAELAKSFFESKGVKVVMSKEVTGNELAERDIIKHHYRMYSEASRVVVIDDLDISHEGREKFKTAFGRKWDAEIKAKRLLSTTELLKNRNINVYQLFDAWNRLFAGGQTVKLQDGVIMGYIDELDAYCINAFYPSMEANFYNSETLLYYYVVEFDPAQVSWKEFRKKVLGATNSSNAVPGSFRGKLYSKYPVQFPGRDNFVHGSAGPVEGFVERIIHEADFVADTNPVGNYLLERDISAEAFKRWQNNLSIAQLGDLFDRTEEMNVSEVFAVLDAIQF